VTPGNAPRAAEDDVLLGPWLAHAREHCAGGNAILWRDAVDFTRDIDSQIQAMINMAGVLRSGLANPRWTYLPVDPALEELRGFLAAIQAEHLPELDVHGYGFKTVECWRVDYGPAGCWAPSATPSTSSSGSPRLARVRLRQRRRPASGRKWFATPFATSGFRTVAAGERRGCPRARGVGAQADRGRERARLRGHGERASHAPRA
jgi:hypothetical protein